MKQETENKQPDGEVRPFNALVMLLSNEGELKTSEIGDKLWGGGASEVNWQRYTLPAAALLNRAEERGLVERREEFGQNYSRTYWRLTPKGKKAV